ncbi:MAG TPA: HIT domain-containing protein, partial [Candidatus Saccharimonadales bacterium]|nr:HIT domain-containing protein [Candidatus Saccharimonadales bacterium]
MDALFAPWRFSYLIQEKREEGCVFCNALRHHGEDAEDSLVVHRGALNLVLLNLYPYNNGHLMVVPNAHLALPSESTPAQRAEMMELSVIAEGVLDDAYHPDGFNVGMNLGRAAGAGIESHFHLHIVPRWSGDTNYMTVMAGTRVIPEDLKRTRDLLRERFAARL